MTFEELLQALLKMTPDQRETEVSLYSYSEGDYIPLPDLNLCSEGDEIHLTIG